MDVIFERLLIELLAIAAEVAIIRLVAWIRSMLAARAQGAQPPPYEGVLAAAA